MENMLRKKMKKYFKNIVEKELIETAKKTNSKIKVKKSDDVFVNMKNRADAMQTSLEKLTENLMKVGNMALDTFTEEILNVDTNNKDKIENELKELIVEKIKKLIKEGSTNKFKE